jgi:hypothetical protein
VSLANQLDVPLLAWVVTRVQVSGPILLSVVSKVLALSAPSTSVAVWILNVGVCQLRQVGAEVFADENVGATRRIPIEEFLAGPDENAVGLARVNKDQADEQVADEVVDCVPARAFVLAATQAVGHNGKRQAIGVAGTRTCRITCRGGA